MVKVYENTDEVFYMDGYLQENLDLAKTIVSKDWDMLFVIDGNEGAGKSVFAQQIAKYLDRSLDLARLTFTPEEFMKAVLSASKYQAIVYDEGYAGLSSKGAMSAVNKTIVKMLTEIRQKNLFIIIVIPTFFDLDKYVAIWRSRALLHVYTADNFERGYFAFYNVDKKKSLFLNGKKFYNYRDPTPNFTGRFSNHYTVDENMYRAKKLESTTKQASQDTVQMVLARKTREFKQLIAENLRTMNLGLTQTQIAQVLNMTTMTIHNYRVRYGVIVDETEENQAIERIFTLPKIQK